MTPEALDDRIHRLIEERDMTKNEVSEKGNVSRSIISKRNPYPFGILYRLDHEGTWIILVSKGNVFRAKRITARPEPDPVFMRILRS